MSERGQGLIDDLFSAGDARPSWSERLGPGSVLLHGFALPHATELWAGIGTVLAAAPLRHMQTAGGYSLSVAMSNCGSLGWLSDRAGYRYTTLDPLSAQAWPIMPTMFAGLAERAAAVAGFPGFVPDACLINRYAPGSRMALHQDRDERDFAWPIVSVSLGLPAVFLFGGAQRSETALRILLEHGDVLVWGGADRLRFHGIMPIKAGCHALTGPYRINLTFRKAQ